MKDELLPLKGRVAVVTGAGGGLGRAHALYLAGKGARVVVNDIALAAAGQVASEIVANGGEALALAASVTDEAAIDRLVRRTQDRWGGSTSSSTMRASCATRALPR